MEESISKNAKIGKNCKFGKGVVIDDEVEIGDNNIFGNFVVISNKVKIGSDNYFSDFISIGRPSCHQIERYEFKEIQDGIIKIGNRNIFREYTSVNLPTKKITEIKNNCFFMLHSHISHDTKISENVVFGNNVQTAGFTYCGNDTFVGYSSATHQVSAIGSFCMIGMGSNVVKDIPPGILAYGNPVCSIKVDFKGLKNKKFEEREIREISSFYEENDSVEEAKKNIESINSLKFRESFMEFLSYSKRDISLPENKIWKINSLNKI